MPSRARSPVKGLLVGTALGAGLTAYALLNFPSARELWETYVPGGREILEFCANLDPGKTLEDVKERLANTQAFVTDIASTVAAKGDSALATTKKSLESVLETASETKAKAAQVLQEAQEKSEHLLEEVKTSYKAVEGTVVGAVDSVKGVYDEIISLVNGSAETAKPSSLKETVKREELKETASPIAIPTAPPSSTPEDKKSVEVEIEKSPETPKQAQATTVQLIIEEPVIPIEEPAPPVALLFEPVSESVDPVPEKVEDSPSVHADVVSHVKAEELKPEPKKDVKESDDFVVISTEELLQLQNEAEQTRVIASEPDVAPTMDAPTAEEELQHVPPVGVVMDQGLDGQMDAEIVMDLPPVAYSDTEREVIAASVSQNATIQKFTLAVLDVAMTMGELMGEMTLESPLGPKLDVARKQLIQLSELLCDLDQEQSNLVRAALEEQGAEFSQVLKDHVEVSYLSMASQAQELKEMYEKKVAESLEEERTKHATELHDQLDAQAKQSEQATIALMNDVVAEMNTQWNKIVREKVDEERGGRLAKLDSLTWKLKELENLTTEAQEKLGMRVKLDRFFLALDAFKSKLEKAPHHPSFATEYKALVKLAKEFPELGPILAVIPKDVSTDGIDTLKDLESQLYHHSQKIRRFQLMPSDGGPLSFALSYLLSFLMFRKRGLVPGNDVESILSRADYYLTLKKDLDSATRELNQLQGWQRLFVDEWIRSARRHLEVAQALDVFIISLFRSTCLVLTHEQIAETYVKLARMDGYTL